MDFHMERTLKAVKGSLNVTIPRQLADELGWKKGDKISFQRLPKGIAMQASATPPALRTVGYEGHTVESFIAALKRAGVRQLLDIRDLPLSRRKGFSKTPLQSALADAGIMYEHIRDLGAPKDVREPFLTGGTHAAFKAAYLAHLNRHRAALDGIRWHMEQATTAIMCVERNHAQCHRGIVAEELARGGVQIQHL